MVTHDVEVLIVGLGPVGSVLALYLAQRGVSVAAIEALQEGATDLRASTFHSATLELLDEIDATAPMIAQGLKAPVYQYRDRASGDVYSFDLGELSDVTRYPFRLQCEQHKMAHEVTRRLEKQSALVSHTHRLLHFDQNETGVTALVETPVAVERYRARFMVGADGGNSTVRKLLDIGFGGFTYDEKFLCLSTRYPVDEAFENLAYVNYISDPDEWLVLLRVPGLWRVLVPAPQDVPDAELLSDTNKDAVFRRMLGRGTPVETAHRTVYRVHQRVCERFAVGRVALVGDAAHLNPPIGGFGLNSGIHDAYNLADKLIAILGGRDELDLIDRYDRQRRTVTNNFIQIETQENTRLMRAGWSSAREEKRGRMEMLTNDPDARRAFLMKTAMFTSLAEAASIA